MTRVSKHFPCNPNISIALADKLIIAIRVDGIAKTVSRHAEFGLTINELEGFYRRNRESIDMPRDAA